MQFSICLVVICLFVKSSSTHSIKTEPRSFTEFVQTIPIGIHFTNLTVHHDLYVGIGNGSLNRNAFKAYIQQDHLYVNYYFQNFEILAQREKDPGRVNYLKKFLLQKPAWEVFLREFYTDFNFGRTTMLIPATLDYVGKQNIAATHDDLGVALATTLPCFTVWRQLAAYWRTLNPEQMKRNPYRKFVEAITKDTSATDFYAFVDGYYTRLNSSNPKELAIKQRMIDAYLESVELEYRFASALLTASPIAPNVTAFTDLSTQIEPKIQAMVINHPLYDDIARGTLPLEIYKVLMQQDYLYMRGFYAAFEFMERKEEDVELKTPLRKYGQDFYNFFEAEFKRLNFGPAAQAAPYTQEYIQHETTTARDRPIGEGLASIYPCYYLWYVFGGKMNEIARNSNLSPHPYQIFLDSVKPSENEPSVNKAKKTLSEYYAKASLEGKYRILQIIRQSIYHELDFANGVYGTRKQF